MEWTMEGLGVMRDGPFEHGFTLQETSPVTACHSVSQCVKHGLYTITTSTEAGVGFCLDMDSG